MRTKNHTLGSHSTRGISLHEDTNYFTLKRAMQEIKGEEVKNVDFCQIMLKSAADCFYNHRGEEFTLQQLADKYSSNKSKPDEKTKKSK